MANVGIIGPLLGCHEEPGPPANPHRVRAGKEKLAAWPTEHDDRATCVCAGRVVRPALAT
jgi:hypothetical protein